MQIDTPEYKLTQLLTNAEEMIRGTGNLVKSAAEQISSQKPLQKEAFSPILYKIDFDALKKAASI